MARTNRFTSTTADVQNRMARVGRIDRTSDRDAIAASVALAHTSDTEAVLDEINSFDRLAAERTYSAGPEFAHSPFAHLANVKVALAAITPNVEAMAQRYEFERSCAERLHELRNTTKIEVYPVTLAEATRRKAVRSERDAITRVSV